MATGALSGTRVLSPARAQTLKAALVAFCLGLGLVYLSGFAYSDSVHDAAHDSHHALAFPCH